jgi:hypothetical protein
MLLLSVVVQLHVRSRSANDKVAKNRPGAAVDGCWVVETGRPATFVAERQTFSSAPDSTCNRAYPSYGSARFAAAGPVDANVLKCQLKPIDDKDYASFTPAELLRLRTIFPAGTCDFSKPGVHQTRVVPWASFGPAPENLVVDQPRRSTRKP